MTILKKGLADITRAKSLWIFSVENWLFSSVVHIPMDLRLQHLH